MMGVPRGGGCHVALFGARPPHRPMRRAQWLARDGPASGGACARDGVVVVVVVVVRGVVVRGVARDARAQTRRIGVARDVEIGARACTVLDGDGVVVVVVVGAPDARARDHARGVRGGRARGRGGVSAGDECVRRGGERVGREGVGARVAGARDATRVRVREGWVWGSCGVCVRGE